jgi:C4-dicarboxylate transporter DctQ subunit
MLEKLDAAMTVFERAMVGSLLIVVTAVVCWGVLERFLIKFGQGWTEEISRYCTIWAAYIGASYGVKTGSHIGVDVFVDHILSKRYRPYVLLLTDICCLIFTVWLTWLSMRYTLRLVGGATSPALFIPMWMIYAAMPVGCLMMSLRYVISIVAGLQALRRPGGR